MAFNFKDSLAVGQAGEETFLAKSHMTLERLDGRNGDFKCLETGHVVELKTDTYDMARTENFFIERWSNVEKHAPGGPWQALQKGNEIFVYLYAQNGVYYTFNTLDLVNRLDEIIQGLTPVSVRNRTWVTVGYKISRAQLVEICERIVLLERGK